MALDNSKLKGIVVLVLALFIAIYLGNAAATNQLEAIGWVVGVAVFLSLLAMGKDIWMLIPFSLLCGLSFPIVPGQFSITVLSQIAFVAFSGLLLVSRRITLSYRLGSTELWVFLVSLTVLQVYFRNPVGLNLLGSASVGAKPYFSFAMAFLTACLLAGSTVTFRQYIIGMRWGLAGGLIAAIVNIVAYIPGLEYYAILFFGAGSYSESSSNAKLAVDASAATRNTAGIYITLFLSRWTISRISPFRALIHPFWLIVIGVSLGAATISGFRNVFANTVMIFAFATYYWSGLKACIVSVFIAGMVIALLAVTNAIVPLPPNIQRSLSFLPGTWEQRYVDDAEGSTEWRIEIWKEVLTSERWIRNKIFGDGLGFTKAELDLQEASRYKKTVTTGASGFDEHRESILVNGDYHSGPVSFVRTTGYVGLILFMLALLSLARQAHRFLKATKGTQWFGLACFFCIPMVVQPIFFFLIFGAFNIDSGLYLVHAGLLRLLQRSFEKEQRQISDLESGPLLA